MTVKEIFALRKQGKIEEAYEAIRARYATYRGKYTTLCMFWTAADVFKLRVQQKRFYEATKIFQALRRVLPNIDDKDGYAAGFMRFAGSQLGQLRRDRATAPAGIKATVPAGSPAVPPASGVLSGSPGLALAGSPSVSVLSDSPAAAVPAGSPASFSPLHFSGESALAPAGSPAPAVAASSVLSGSPAAAVPAGSPAVPPAPAVSASSVLSGFPAEGLNPGQQKVLDCIRTNPGLKVPGIETETGIPAKSIERHISVLIERRLIEHRGSKKTGGYHVVTNE